MGTGEEGKGIEGWVEGWMMGKIWAAEWHSRNILDGETRYIINENYVPKLFHTRRACRQFIQEKYGYIAIRPDLRQEPHGWRMPTAIKVKVQVAQ